MTAWMPYVLPQTTFIVTMGLRWFRLPGYTVRILKLNDSTVVVDTRSYIVYGWSRVGSNLFGPDHVVPAESGLTIVLVTGLHHPKVD